VDFRVRAFSPLGDNEILLLPASVQDHVPADHLSRFIVALVRQNFDLSKLFGSYTSGLGQPPLDPRMMTAAAHRLCKRIYFSRRITKACEERADFMMIVAGDAPDFRTISEFRKPHLQALARLFVPVLKLAEKAGLVKLGMLRLAPRSRRTHPARLPARSCRAFLPEH
jgi:transposase